MKTITQKLTGNIAIYRSVLNSGHKLDRRKHKDMTAQKEMEAMVDELLSYKISEPEFCTICGSKDRDKEHDHLRHCYKVSQDLLSNTMFKPQLIQEEMNTLERGENPICSNRALCRKRLLNNQ